MEPEEFKNQRGGVFSLKRIVFDGKPVLHVAHDLDDDWQFLGLEDADENEIVFVHLSHLIEVDPSLLGIKDLPRGWHAWRDSIEKDWKIEKITDDYSED